VGPVGYVELHDGEAVVQALWDDQRGVQVSMSIPDFAMTIEELQTLRGLVDELISIPAPRHAETR
jgi:hypothetical protein